MAFPTGWGRKCALVIQASKVDSSQSDFPVLLTEDTLPSEMFDADGSYPALNGGGDIRFSSDSAGSTQLACEIVTFTTDNDPANGVAEIWVKVPSVSSSTNTTIYIFYNKAGESQPASSDTYGSENVWDSNFKMVHHMNDATTSTIIDSTSNNNDGTKKAANEPIESTGQIGKGQDFDGSDNYVNCGSNSSLDDIAIKMIELWTNLDAQTGTGIGSHFINKGVWFLSTDPDNSRNIFGQNFTVNNGRWSFPQFSLGEWHHLVIVYDQQSVNNDPIIYVDDVSQTVTEYNTPDGSIKSDASNDLLVSKDPDNPRWVDGRIDEIRISNVARSADWIKAEYNNQNDPSTFVIEGTPETIGQSDLFDGKVKIKDSTIDLFDGRVKVKDSIVNLFDGKAIIACEPTNLFDGKVKIKDSVTDLFDGKVIIQNKIDVVNLFDGKVKLDQLATNLFDGKVKIKDSVTDLFNGKVKIVKSKTDLFDGKVVILRTEHIDVDSGIKGKEFTSIDSGIVGLPTPQTWSGIWGKVEDLTTRILSGISGIDTKDLDIDSGITGLGATEASSGILGLVSSIIRSGIIGGEADVFGFSYPLADPIPLRNTTIWGSFKNVQTIHHAYGRVRLAPIPYEKTRKFFVLADHGIQGVDEVQIDDETIYAWKFKNTLDSSDSPVAMLELGEALPDGSSLIALIRGKVHPVTGVLLTSPADIIWDILANIAGASVSYSDLDKFRVECAIYGIEISGLLDDRERSIKKQLDLITESVGAIWSGGMPGLARIYPVED